MVYAFFWYGGFNPDSPPDGFAESILTIDGNTANITAYIPVNGNTDIGFIVAWYANQVDFGDDPDGGQTPATYLAVEIIGTPHYGTLFADGGGELFNTSIA